MNTAVTISEIGEKRLISDYIRPFFNPNGKVESVGDDCALVQVATGCACVSTDRVPADLTAYRLGIISPRGLGQYLAVLNISDVAAAGGRPLALLLNFALPPQFKLVDLLDIFKGVQDAATAYACPVLGGDLSDSSEISLSATVIGEVRRNEALLRSGARPGHIVFCSEEIGLTNAAFEYHRSAASRDGILTPTELEELHRHFCQPRAMVRLGELLRSSGACSSAMDNTDGISQTLNEIAQAGRVLLRIDKAKLPIHPLSRKIATHLGTDSYEIAFGPGADFQLVGTVDPDQPGYAQLLPHITQIGSVECGQGVVLHDARLGTETAIVPKGWNYFSKGLCT